MKRLLLLLPVLALCLLTLVSCTAANGGSGAGSSGSTATTAGTAADIADTITFASDDYYFDWQSKTHQTITLGKDKASVSQSGIYEITGTLKDGSLVVDVEPKTDSGTVYLVLNNASISSTTSAPIYVKNAQKVVLILENGTTNTIYQGSGCVVNSDGEPSAAVFSKADLTVTGDGTLNLTSDYNDGITSKDTLKITDGTLNIQSKEDGMVGKDVLAVKQGTITVTAGKDGIRSTNDTDADLGNVLVLDGTLTVTSGDETMQASGTLQINGGTFNLTSGGGYAKNTTVHTDNGGFGGGPGQAPGQTQQTSSSTETDSNSIHGISAARSILINSGQIAVSAYDDAVHSDGEVKIGGGTLTLQSGDDGIHSDTTVIIDKGTIAIKNSYEGIEGKSITVNSGKIDLTSSDDGFNVNDSSGVLTINGGDIVLNAEGDGADSNGSEKMTGGTLYINGPTANDNAAIDYDQSFNISGGTIVAAGSSGMAQSPDADSSQFSILMYYSTTQKAGTTVTLKDSSGNTVASYTPTKEYASVVISAPGLKKSQSYTLYSGNTKVVTFTPSDTVTYLNESGITQNQSQGPGGNGGMQGGNPGGNPGNNPDGTAGGPPNHN